VRIPPGSFSIVPTLNDVAVLRNEGGIDSLSLFFLIVTMLHMLLSWFEFSFFF
jgi:hypothetical protein